MAFLAAALLTASSSHPWKLRLHLPKSISSTSGTRFGTPFMGLFSTSPLSLVCGFERVGTPPPTPPRLSCPWHLSHNMFSSTPGMSFLRLLRSSLIYTLLTFPPPALPHTVQLRNVVFSVVAQRAIRRVARDVFEHLHDLDMSYHLAKNTGTVSRIIDRGGENLVGHIRLRQLQQDAARLGWTRM